MQFLETRLAGVFVVQLEPRGDERGFFARSWCEREFAALGLNAQLVQCNISFNKVKGTLRGMHYQAAPHEEDKLVRCTRGALFDVAVDLRPDSPTFREWVGVELSGENRDALYIPKGFAHGFQTLEDNTEIFYQMSTFYEPGAGRGVRWDDPLLDITWPLPATVINQRDLAFPLLEPVEAVD